MNIFIYIYLFWLTSRTIYIGIYGIDETSSSLENFEKLNIISKGVVIVVGAPVYIILEIVPRIIHNSIILIRDNVIVTMYNLLIDVIKWILNNIILTIYNLLIDMIK